MSSPPRSRCSRARSRCCSCSPCCCSSRPRCGRSSARSRWSRWPPSSGCSSGSGRCSSQPGCRARSRASSARRVATGRRCDPRQRFNVGLVMFVSQALQVLIVSFAVGVFFIAFGLLAVEPGTMNSWISPDKAHYFGPTVHILGENIRRLERAAARLRRPRRVQRPLLRDRRAHRRDLPRGVPRGADV